MNEEVEEAVEVLKRQKTIQKDIETKKEELKEEFS